MVPFYWVVVHNSSPHHLQGSSTERWSRNTLRVVTARVFYVVRVFLTGFEPVTVGTKRRVLNRWATGAHSSEQRIKRLITFDLQITWGTANHIRFKAASPDTFVNQYHEQEIRSDYVASPSVL